MAIDKKIENRLIYMQTTMENKERGKKREIQELKTEKNRENRERGGGEILHKKCIWT